MLSASCELLIGLEDNSFIRAKYQIQDYELMLSSPPIEVVRPPNSLVKAFSSLFKSKENEDFIASIASVSDFVVTLSSSGALRVWSFTVKMYVLAEATVADSLSIYKCVVKAQDTAIIIATAFESNDSYCVSVHRFIEQDLALLTVLYAPLFFEYFDLDLSQSMVAVMWRAVGKTELACYSLTETCCSKALLSDTADDGPTSMLGVTCTDCFAAVIRNEFIGVLRSPVNQLEKESWLVGSLSTQYSELAKAYDAEMALQMRIESQSSELYAALALVRLWRPRLFNDERVMDYIVMVQEVELPYQIGILLQDMLTPRLIAHFKMTHDQLNNLLAMGQLVHLDESASAWPHSAINLLSQSLVSLSFSLTELAIDLLVLAQLIADRPEFFDIKLDCQLQDLTATTESCLAIFRGLSYTPKFDTEHQEHYENGRPVQDLSRSDRETSMQDQGVNAAPAVTMVLLERSASLIGFTDNADARSLTKWLRAKLSSIFQHFSLLLPSRNNCDSPTLLSLLVSVGQIEAAASMLDVLPPCYAGFEFESALCGKVVVDRVSVLVDSVSEGSSDEFLTGRWCRLASPSPGFKGDKSTKFLSLVSCAEKVHPSVRHDATQMLAYLAQGKPEIEDLICDIYHNFINQGQLKAAFSVLVVMSEPALHIGAFAKALLNSDNIDELPRTWTTLRKLLVESVKALAEKELFNSEMPLQCSRYSKYCTLINGSSSMSTRQFVGFHDLLYFMHLQIGQFTEAAATMYNYACKIELAIKLEGIHNKTKDFCIKLLRDSLLCASAALRSSQSDKFIAETISERSDRKRSFIGASVEAHRSDTGRMLVTKESLQQKLAELFRIS